jgi:AraC family transcriptional regulator
LLSLRKTNEAMSSEAARRISIDDNGHRIPLVPQEPLLSSSSQHWEGCLFERHHLAGSFEVPKHNHSSVLLSMQLNASLHLGWRSGAGERNAVVEAGTLTLHGGCGCNSSTWLGDYDRVVLEIDPAHLQRLTEGSFAGAKVEVEERWMFRDPRLEYLLKVLHEELQQGAPAGRLFSEQIGNSVAMLLARQYAVVKPAEFGAGGRIPTSRLKRVFEYIDAHIDQEIRLSNLAETASMSPFYFARLFKNSTGVTPHQYVATRRMERAKEMLRHSDTSIFEIGIRVGYLDPKHFRTLFRREVGISPSEFRTAHP